MKKTVLAIAAFSIGTLAFYSCSPADPADHGLTENDVLEYRADSAQFYALAAERRALMAYVDSFAKAHEETIIRDGYVVSGLENLLPDSGTSMPSFIIVLEQKQKEREAVLLMIQKNTEMSDLTPLKDSLPGYNLYLVDSGHVPAKNGPDPVTEISDYITKRERLNLVRSQIDFLREKWLGYLK